jgi:hypothetical protein
VLGETRLLKTRSKSRKVEQNVASGVQRTALVDKKLYFLAKPT